MHADEINRRIAYVRNFFASGDLGPREAGDPAFVAKFVAPDIWNNGPGILRGATFMGDHFDLGFTAPNLRDGRFVTFMCAEVLVSRTSGSPEADFLSYIESVRLHVLLHILELDKGTPFEDHEAAVLRCQATVVDQDFALYESVTAPGPWRSL